MTKKTITPLALHYLGDHNAWCYEGMEKLPCAHGFRMYYSCKDCKKSPVRHHVTHKRWETAEKARVLAQLGFAVRLKTEELEGEVS